ncbi:tetratricopeptide repeat protein [Cytophagales bacterium LB-30]|uniref:Tetratricopeptide repeat protein n=1 Tax=Shiella aurantiaca TaxID=3058365 RepID=A0ABT8F781_9BACT|nr:tetratricopeptide repeat protein [Shiella aurantiaca]MDN4165816.1 tetratricopeptide repeat protein [Shiella aurantiaca]
MATKVAEKKNKKAESAIENPEVLVESLTRTEEYIERNKSLIIGIGAAVAIVIAGFIGYRYWVSSQNEEAQKEIFQAVYYFEAQDYDKALNGDGNNYGFLEIITNYGATDAAELAHFYAGTIYLNKGEFDLAIDYLKDFAASDLLVQARAYSLIGDAYMEKGDFAEAASYYSKAANYNSNKFFSPTYLVKAAIANEKAGDVKAAKANLETIVTEYADASEYQYALKHKARLEGLIAQ